MAQVDVYAGPGGLSVELGGPRYYHPYRGYYGYAPGWHHGWRHRHFYGYYNDWD